MVNLMATVLFRHGLDNKCKLVYAGEIQNEIVEWKGPPIFQIKSWSSTVVMLLYQ